jgi:hypothetical protein
MSSPGTRRPRDRLEGAVRRPAGSGDEQGLISHEDLSRHPEATGRLARAAGRDMAVVADRPAREDNYETPASAFWQSPGVTSRPRKASDRLAGLDGFREPGSPGRLARDPCGVVLK